MHSKLFISFFTVLLIQLSQSQYVTRPMNTGFDPNYQGVSALTGNPSFHNPELTNPGYSNFAPDNAALRNSQNTAWRSQNGMAFAENVAFNSAHGSPVSYNGMAINPANMAGYNENGVFNGGSFVVSSSSPLSPNGVSVKSDNLLVEGPLSVTGQMPLLGVVSLEGGLPAIGQGAVSYKSGNGEIGMVGENLGGNFNNFNAGRQNVPDRFMTNNFGMNY